MRIDEIINQPCLRIHNSVKRIHSLVKGYPQHDGRKPNGLWWAMGDQWTKFVIDKKPKGKKVGDYQYCVKLSDTCKIATLINWEDILHFTIMFGITAAPKKQFFWQKGDQSVYDPTQDEWLKSKNRCRVGMIDWRKVATEFDAIELPEYEKPLNRQRPWVEWLDTDWDIPSGCVWDITKIESMTRIANENR